VIGTEKETGRRSATTTALVPPCRLGAAGQAVHGIDWRSAGDGQVVPRAVSGRDLGARGPGGRSTLGGPMVDSRGFSTTRTGGGGDGSDAAGENVHEGARTTRSSGEREHSSRRDEEEVAAAPPRLSTDAVVRRDHGRGVGQETWRHAVGRTARSGRDRRGAAGHAVRAALRGFEKTAGT